MKKGLKKVFLFSSEAYNTANLMTEVRIWDW